MIRPARPDASRLFQSQARAPVRPWLVLGAGVVVLSGVAWVDAAFAPLLRVDPLYALVLGLTAWFGGAVAGAALATLAVLLAVVPDVVGRGEVLSFPILAWNVAGTYGLYLGSVLVLVTLRRSLRAERSAARTDALTGLPNRRAFQALLETEAERAQRYGSVFSVAYLDLDGFKEINDRHGHDAGDRALRLVGDTLDRVLRDADFAARLGGDEFAILLPETETAGAEMLLERVREELYRTLQRRGWSVTVSVGLYAPAGATADAREILRRADHLMYAAKQDGKDRVRSGSGDDGLSGSPPDPGA